GTIFSLKQGSSELLQNPTPLSRIYLNNGTTGTPKKVTSVGNNQYLIEYVGTDIKSVLGINPTHGYYEFSLISLDRPSEVKKVELFNIPPKFVAQAAGKGTAAISADQNQIFIHALPLNVDTECTIDSNQTVYKCEALEWLGFSGIKGVLV